MRKVIAIILLLAAVGGLVYGIIFLVLGLGSGIAFYFWEMRRVRQVVVTGGSLIRTARTGEIAAHALYSPADPMSLRPLKADVRVDRKYILAAMGQLSEYDPKTALCIMKKELEYNGYSE